MEARYREQQETRFQRPLLLALTSLALSAVTLAAQRPELTDTAAQRAPTLAEVPIVSETRDTAFGLTTWTLANGARVILKPTSSASDPILLAAISPGGLSLVPDSLVRAGLIAAEVVQASRLGHHEVAERQDSAAGTTAQVTPYIGWHREGLFGSASPQDLHALLELTYESFTAPERLDSAALGSFRTALRNRLVSRAANPFAVFQDTIEAVLAQGHPRYRPLTAAAVDSLDPAAALAIYRDRFGNAADFTFVLIGAFTVDRIEPLVRRYIGNLPTTHARETPRIERIEPPAGIVRRTVRKGSDSRSQTALVFTGAGAATRAERFLLTAVARILEMRLRAELGEAPDGPSAVTIYPAPVSADPSTYRAMIRFDAAVGLADKLVGVIFAHVDSLRRYGATPMELAKLADAMTRERAAEIGQNGFWLGQLVSAAEDVESLRQSLDSRQPFATLTGDQVAHAAARYLDPIRYVQATLLPEEASADLVGAPRVFLDCLLCPLTRVLQEIPFVQWVRDRNDADLHVLVTQQPTGAGQMHRFAFLGRGALTGRADTLTYLASRTATADEIADGIVRTLQLGLVQYAAGTPVGSRLRVVFEPLRGRDGAPRAGLPVRDPWNAWVFAVNLSGSASGEQQYRSTSVTGALSASRTTAAVKLAMLFSGSYQRSTYKLSPTQAFETVERDYLFSSLAAQSLGAHWAAGFVASAASRSFYNQDLAVQGGPAIEYNVFPYDESARRQLTVRYAVKPQLMRYAEATIFDKFQETLMTHSLDVALQFMQPWGSASTRVAAAQYLGDLAKHHVSMQGTLNLRLYRGVSLSLYGSVSRIKDQVYLPKGGLTDEEILTRRRQLGTDYAYSMQVGLTYQFGSALSGIVNPRLVGAE
ncbi:MAG TPA: insulinase family protein [Gemmatimonadales bacterium]|nr:insulinase family protein [Gemmatimonadales bacterium]